MTFFLLSSTRDLAPPCGALVFVFLCPNKTNVFVGINESFSVFVSIYVLVYVKVMDGVLIHIP